jgi:DNA-directed RNA polymerase subunit K/omega
MRKALERVGNPHILVNIISRRVRQLNSGGGGFSKPLVDGEPGEGTADLALRELLEEKIGYELLTEEKNEAPAPKKRRRAAAAA